MQMVELIENQDTFDVDEIPRHDRPIRLGVPSSMELTRVIRSDDMKGEYITDEDKGISLGLVDYVDTIDGVKNHNYNVVVFRTEDNTEIAQRSYSGQGSKEDAKDKAREWAMMVHNGLLE